MARQPRVEFPGAFYHVITRGNNRQVVFRDTQDYRRLLESLTALHQDSDVRVYAFVLMPNHLHLLIETGQEWLSHFMQRLLTRYTMTFNRRHRQSGHLFQGRYKALLCQKESYLLELVRYLHLNPVRARLVHRPEQWPWSSHRAYLGLQHLPVVESHWVLRQFGRTLPQARQAYRKFISDGLDADSCEDLTQGVHNGILGDGAFIEQIQRRARGGRGEAAASFRPTLTLHELLERVSKLVGLPTESVIARTGGRQASLARALVAYVGTIRLGYRGRVLATFLHCDPSAITHAVRRLHDSLEHKGALSAHVARLVGG